MLEMEVKKLQDEIDHLKCLVCFIWQVVYTGLILEILCTRSHGARMHLENAHRRFTVSASLINRSAYLQAHEREEKAKHNDTTLKFREEKIRRLELLVDDKVTTEKYLVEENKALLEEINSLRERIDENPELKQFAAENNRLTEQLQL